MTTELVPPTATEKANRSPLRDAAIVVAALAAGVAVVLPGAGPSVMVGALALAVVVAFLLDGLLTSAALLPVIALIARPLLDLFKGVLPIGVDPSQLLGAVVLALTVIWLAGRRALWTRLSAFSVAGLIFLGTLAMSVPGSLRPGTSAIELTRIGAAVGMVVLLDLVLLERPARRGVLVAAIMVSAALPMVIGLGQVATGRGLISIGGFDRVSGPFLHPNPFAIFLVFTLLFAVANLPRTHGWVQAGCLGVTALSGVLLAFTYTRGAWIAAVLGVLVLGVVQGRRRLVMGLLAIGVLALVLTPAGDRLADIAEGDRSPLGEPTNSLTWRFDQWNEVIDLFADSPVTGAGLGVSKFETPDQEVPHNDYVRIAGEAGILGLLGYLGLLGAMAHATRRALRAARTPEDHALASAAAACLAAFVVLSATANVISQVIVLWHGFAIMAVGVMGVAARNRSGRGDTSPVPDPDTAGGVVHA